MWWLLFACHRPADPEVVPPPDTGVVIDSDVAGSEAVDTDGADSDVGANDSGGDSSTVDSGAGDSDAGDSDATDTDSLGGDTGSGGDPDAGRAPDFLLDDVNPTSARYGEAVSPRDYIGKVAGFYFTHAT